MDGDLPVRSDVPLVFDELDHQMACQVYLWALPLVSYAQWHQQHRDVFGATNFDLVRYVSYRDRLGLITANATTPYILNFIELAETGPLVIELPAGPTAGGVSDFWQREIRGARRDGPRRGTRRQAPRGTARPGPARRRRGLQRAALDGHEHHVRVPHPRSRPARSKALVDAVRIYPYDQRDDPPVTRIISPDGRAWTGDQPRGLEYWVRLHGIYQSEVVDERDRFFLAMLKQLGIEKGRPFEPDERLAAILDRGELRPVS